MTRVKSFSEMKSIFNNFAICRMNCQNECIGHLAQMSENARFPYVADAPVTP